MSGIFINYRREDSGGEAAHLRDDLVERFGEDNVFLDLGDIVPGADYLPPEIQQLRHLQAAPLRNPDWRNDVARLVGRLQHLVPVAQPAPGDHASTTPLVSPLVKWSGGILFVVSMVIFVVIFVAAVAFILSGAGTVLGR